MFKTNQNIDEPKRLASRYIARTLDGIKPFLQDSLTEEVIREIKRQFRCYENDVRTLLENQYLNH